jgi:F-type H+-transporting ATPase subunit b
MPLKCEKLSMLRQSILPLGMGVVAVLLALSVLPGRVSAAETPPEAPHQVRAEAEAASGHAPAAEGKKTNPMELQPALAFYTLIVFLGLFYVLARFAWKPLIQALHEREAHLEHCLLQTEKARNEGEQLLAEHRRLMAQADDQVRAMLEKAQKDAQAHSEEMIRLAQAEAEAARDRAEREIAVARDQALAEIWSQTAEMAVSVAGKVLTKQLNEEDHRRLLDLAIKELPAAPASSNGHGGSLS